MTYRIEVHTDDGWVVLKGLTRKAAETQLDRLSHKVGIHVLMMMGESDGS